MLTLYLPLVLAYTQPEQEPNANAAYNPSQKGSDWSGEYIPSQKGPDCELLKTELKKVFDAYDAVKPGCEEKTIEETPALGKRTRCYTVGLCDEECKSYITTAVQNYGRIVDQQHQFLPTGDRTFDLSPVHQVLNKINYESFDFLENNPACGVMMGDSVYGEERSLCKAKYFHCGPIPCHEIVAPTLREHSVSFEEFTRRCEKSVSIACKVAGVGYKEARTTVCFAGHCKCVLNAERRLDSSDNYGSPTAATAAPPTPSYVAPTAAPTNQVYTPSKFDGICEPNLRDLSVYTIYLKLSILYAADEGVFDRLPNCAADSLVPFLTEKSQVKHTYKRRRRRKKTTNYLPYILGGAALFLILVVILVVYIKKISGSKDDPGAVNLANVGWRQGSDPGQLDSKKKKEKRKSGERSQSPKSPKMPDTSPSSRNPKLPDTSPRSKNLKLPYASASSKSPRSPRDNKPDLSPGRVLSPLELSTIVTSPSGDRKMLSPRFNDRRDRRKVKLPATSPTNQGAASNFVAE